MLLHLILKIFEDHTRKITIDITRTANQKMALKLQNHTDWMSHRRDGLVDKINAGAYQHSGQNRETTQGESWWGRTLDMIKKKQRKILTPRRTGYNWYYSAKIIHFSVNFFTVIRETLPN